MRRNLELGRKTTYFHMLSSIKNKTNTTSSLKIRENPVSGPTLTEGHVVKFYKSLYCTEPLLHEHYLVEEVIPHLVN